MSPWTPHYSGRESPWVVFVIETASTLHSEKPYNKLHKYNKQSEHLIGKKWDTREPHNGTVKINSTVYIYIYP